MNTVRHEEGRTPPPRALRPGVVAHRLSSDCSLRGFLEQLQLQPI